MLAQGILRVKGQRSSRNHSMLILFVSWRNKYAIHRPSFQGLCAIIEWPLFDAPTSTIGVFTYFSLSRYCCLHFCRNKFGLLLVRGYFKGQRSGIYHKLQILWLCVICNHRVVRPKKKNSLSQLPARIAFKNPNLPHFFFFFRFLRDFHFFHLFFSY